MSTTRYDVLPTLGDGSYGTLEADRLNLGPNKSVLVQHPETTLSWEDLLNRQGSQHFFLAVSDLEFEKMAEPTSGTGMSFDGSLRAHNNWFQLVINTTAGDAIRTLAYHVSQGHVTSPTPQDRATFKLISWVPDVNNMLAYISKGKCNAFQRANSMTMFQVLDGQQYRMTSRELNTLVIAEVHGDPTTVFEQYTWGNGFGWTYQQPLDMRALCDLPFDHALHYAGRQSLEYIAQDGITYFPSDLQVRINVCICKMIAYQMKIFHKTYAIIVSPKVQKGLSLGLFCFVPFAHVFF